MRYVLPLFAFLLMALTNYAQNTVPTTIDAVTVYRQTARISHTGTANIPAGSSEIIIDNLSASIILPSVQVQLSGGATILSVTSRVNHNKPKPNLDKIAPLNDTIAQLNNQMDWIENQRQVYQAEESVLNEKLKMVGTETGLPVVELEKLVALYRSRMMDIKERLFKLKNDTKAINDQKGLVQTKINEINSQTVTPTGEIVVTVLANGPTKALVKCSYMANNAGWTPIYDLRCDGIEKPVSLNYYAQVYQNTGFDWKNVKLTVSTSNPSQNNSRPVLVPLYVDFVAPYILNYQSNDAVTNSATYTKVKDIARLEENYDGPTYDVTVTETQLNAEYDIVLAQTIPSDGKARQVPLKDYDLPATYVYHTVPRMDNGAFLLAKITNWGQYNLLAGTANLFFEERYIGQSVINPQTTSDTLLLSMGRDEKINIQRIPLIDKESRRFFGGTRKEKRTSEIIVRNNKSKPIKLEILDQILVSRQESIKIVLLDHGGAEYTDEIGKLMWRLELAPGETKKVRFSFEVSYPKDKTLPPF
ncbi:hypothetical protein BH09BAC1_BH09BAC1_21680 [soil metagenome]